jgi:hypothetical protein
MDGAELSAAGAAAPPRTINRSLVRPTWIVLAVGWLIILLPVPLTGIVGILIAGWCGLIMAVVNLVRGVVTTGILQFLAATAGTALVYLISWAIFVAMLGMG